MSDDELAFYDALEVNDSAVKVLGDEASRDRPGADRAGPGQRPRSIGPSARTCAPSSGVLVKRIQRKHGYPPDKQERATKTGFRASRSLLQRVGSRVTSRDRPRSK